MIYYLETNSYNPYYNLAFEEYFFNSEAHFDTCIMLWQNDKSAIIGRYQNIFEEINLNYANENKIKIVRRNSGGGAVYHDLGNLNYSIITNNQKNNDIKTLSFPIIQALKELGYDVYFSGRNDIFYKDFKISGNAQYITDNKLLHHGTLLIQSDLDILSKVLMPKIKFDDSCALPSIKSKVLNLNDIQNKKINIEEIKTKIKKNFAPDKEYKISDYDISKIKKLQEQKYEKKSWNYNKMPEFNFSNKRKFNFGSLEVNCLIENKKIKQIVFSGDFFALCDIEELEKNLIGQNIENLNKVKFDNYFKGITTEEVLSLFDVFNFQT